MELEAGSRSLAERGHDGFLDLGAQVQASHFVLVLVGEELEVVAGHGLGEAMLTRRDLRFATGGPSDEIEIVLRKARRLVVDELPGPQLRDGGHLRRQRRLSHELRGALAGGRRRPRGLRSGAARAVPPC